MRRPQWVFSPPRHPCHRQRRLATNTTATTTCRLATDTTATTTCRLATNASGNTALVSAVDACTTPARCFLRTRFDHPDVYTILTIATRALMPQLTMWPTPCQKRTVQGLSTAPSLPRPLPRLNSQLSQV
eukprot:351767-Chlamydomonas_euryale.AAC.3